MSWNKEIGNVIRIICIEIKEAVGIARPLMVIIVDI